MGEINVQLTVINTHLFFGVLFSIQYLFIYFHQWKVVHIHLWNCFHPLKLFIQLYCTESHQQYENWVLHSLIFTVSMFTIQFVNKCSQNKHLSI